MKVRGPLCSRDAEKGSARGGVDAGRVSWEEQRTLWGAVDTEEAWLGPYRLPTASHCRSYAVVHGFFASLHFRIPC